MRGSRVALQVLGWLMLLSGLLWAAQGAGFFPYPAASPMIAQIQWVWYGLAMALAGVIVVIAAHRSSKT